MAGVVITNPVINSPFEEPQRHYFLNDQGITDKIIPKRRTSAYFVPIARARTRSDGQQTIEDWTGDRIEENPRINQIRARVRLWREGRYSADTTRVTARLLEHWKSPERERRLFFCQVEALETIIYLTEVANKVGDQWIENDLSRLNTDANPGLYRLAMKMATGSGKTAVMAMLIAWHTLNKAANPQDARFTDAFLVVTPGITIRDRLRVLLPSDPANYYEGLDIVPTDLRDSLGRAKVVITNFHAFRRREKVKIAKLTKQIVSGGNENSPALVETPGEMVRRVCRELGMSKQIVVLNDEAHHCYQRKPAAEGEKLKGEERKEAEKRTKAAHQWLGGLRAVAQKVGIKAVYDLSATPFFLSGSGYSEGMLFPWVVSDFSLLDAIESGIVKVPRVPVSDDSMVGAAPTYRDLWIRIRDDLPKGSSQNQDANPDPNLPAELEGALRSLYSNYEKRFKKWEADRGASDGFATPPVFIVVCNNINVSKMVNDWIAGYEKTVGSGDKAQTVVVPGNLRVFNNVHRGPDGQNCFLHRPNTILVNSEELESGEAMSADFKKIAGREIEEFKHEYRQRYPGADVEKLTDEDLLREVLNTVGKPGRLGEHVRCVVSVSMLTEGWDANTVTHILGVRAFGTQLLCEQVVGRGLRRMSYRPRSHSAEVDGRSVEFDAFPVEYAEVYGVPFSFIPSNGHVTDPKPGPPPTRVRALEERANLEIVFPRVQSYRYELPDAPLEARFTEDSNMAISTRDLPSKVEVAPLVGEREIHTLDDLQAMRPKTVAFALAKRVYETFVKSKGGDEQPWRFPEVLAISTRWLAECLTLKDRVFLQMLRITELEHKAARKVFAAIVEGDRRPKRIIANIPEGEYGTGSTRGVDFDTARPTWETRADKCHISHVVCDTESWEQKASQALEDMDEVICYAKNHQLHFLIPYTHNGETKRYMPDFLVHLDDGHGRDDPLRLILEVSGQADGDIGEMKKAKTTAARTLWVPAVNASGRYGRWAFIEISDPWDLQNTIRKRLPELSAAAAV